MGFFWVREVHRCIRVREPIEPIDEPIEPTEQDLMNPLNLMNLLNLLTFREHLARRPQMLFQRRRLCPDRGEKRDRRQLPRHRVERPLPVHAAARRPDVPAGDSLQLIDLALPRANVKCRLDMPIQLRLRVPECAERRNSTELTRPHVETGT